MKTIICRYRIRIEKHIAHKLNCELPTVTAELAVEELTERELLEMLELLATEYHLTHTEKLFLFSVMP